MPEGRACKVKWSRLVVLYGAHFSSYVLPLVEMVVYSRLLGVGEYSSYLYGYAIALSVGFAGEYGVTISGPANAAGLPQDGRSLRLFHLSLLPLRMIVWFVVFGGAVLFLRLQQESVISAAFLPVIAVLSLALTLSQFYFFYMRQDPGRVLGVDIVMRFLPVVVVALLSDRVWKAIDVLLLLAFFQLASLIFQYILFVRLLPPAAGKRITFAELIRTGLRYGRQTWPAALQRVLMPLQSSVFLSNVEIHMGSSGLALLAGPERLVRAAIALVQPLVTFLLPSVMLEGRTRVRFYALLLAAASAVAVIGMILSPYLLQIFLDIVDSRSVDAMQLLLVILPVRVFNIAFFQLDLLRRSSGASGGLVNIASILIVYAIAFLLPEQGFEVFFILCIFTIETLVSFSLGVLARRKERAGHI